MIINNVLVYTKDYRFERMNVRIANGVYEKLCTEPVIPENGEDIIDGYHLRLIPGLTDIHFHGCMGSDLCDGTDEAISVMAGYEKSAGVLNICPATMTLPTDRLKKICETAAMHRGGEDEAELIGINLEGPFISPQKVGAQNPEYVAAPDAGALEELLVAANGMIRLVTIAPEVEGAMECISRLSGRVHFSVGHTDADYDRASESFARGADHVTHLFNAMPPLHHRNPGVIGAAAERDNVYAEIICDGVHVHASCVRAAFRLFGSDRIVLISDSMRACGMPDGDYELGGIPVIKNGRVARQQSGTIAGSVTNLYDCMTEAVNMGISAEDAIRAAACNPPASIGMGDELGIIDEGRRARALLIDSDWKIVRII